MWRMVVPALLATLAFTPTAAFAHCDALDGPVVQAARAALDSNDVRGVLRWVPADRESDVRAAFTRTLAVRGLGGDARTLAETWFFETLVRIHRAGEGAPFDGLKPAGHIEPVIAAVDRSMLTGAVDPLVSELSGRVDRSIRERFARAHSLAARADDNVEAGRAYVAAYVDYVHYVEALHRTGETIEHSAIDSHAHPGER